MNKSRSDESDDVSDSHDEAEDAPEEEEDDEEPDDGDSDSSSSNASSSLSASTSASGATHSFTSRDNEFEQAKILPQQKPVSLPRGLCENPSIFREFFSPATWKALSPQERAHLQQFLPQFDGLVNADEEEELLEATVNQLFTGQLQHFGVAPIEKFRHNLEEGNYRPDVYELRKSIAKSKRREQRFQECERLSQLAKELFISREKFLQQVNKSLPGAILKTEHRRRRQHTSLLYGDTRLSAVRARKRFYKELTQCTQSVTGSSGYLSADDESPQKDALTAEEWRLDAELQQSISDEISAMKAGGPGSCLTTATDKCIYATNFKRRSELTDEEALRAEQHSKKSQLTNRTLKQCLLDHRRRKQLQPNLPDFETSDIRLRDVCARAQIGTSSKRAFSSGKQPGRKPKYPKMSNSVPSISEPPALVPIQPHRYDEISQQDSRLARVSPPPPTTDQAHRQQPPALHVFAERHERTTLADRTKSKPDLLGLAGNSHEPHYEPYGAILDNDVELQQVEVESTYGEETANSNDCTPAAAAKPSGMLPFVISKEIELPHSAELPEKVFQTPQKDRKRQAKDDEVKGRSCRQNLNMTMPKLEPLSANPTHKSPKDRLSIGGVRESLSGTTPASDASAEQLLQDTHECFFSLLRELFCATPQYRLSHTELRHKVDLWLRNPIAALNNWYPQVSNWSTELRNILRFLAGDLPPQPEDYVPYVEYKKHLDMYQWIGAGRDSDAHLEQLCEFWLLHRNPPLPPVLQNEEPHREPSIPELITIGEQRVGSPQIAGDSLAGDNQLPVIPPSRCPTTWKVKPSTPDEIAEFQRQERERFEQPHKAYTYRMHGYESVVGPVKGIYNQVLAMTKAREHSMMVGDRPNFVTILTLVRDATACLPNGEGTRSDISELLKCSQYISRDAAETVLQTIVSGALDRMHTEQDPCVQYDPRRKIWIYLHRHRSEEEFERMHQQHQNQPLLKAKKVPQRKPKPKAPPTKGGDNDNGAATASSPANLTPMPALVPSSPLICQMPNGATVVAAHPGPPKLAAVSPKSLPVPPLKYNIPTSQQHQKSLLKPTYNSQRDGNAAKQTPAGKTLPGIVGASELQQQQMPPALSATVGGKRVALNKPIIINQINQQVASKAKNQLKSPQGQQQQPQNILIPLSGLSGEQQQLNLNSGQDSNVKTILLDNNQQFLGTEEAKQPQQSMKNIIRLVPSSIASSSDGVVRAGVASKPSVGGGKQQQQVIGQRNVLQQQGGISIIANNSGNSTGTAVSGPAGTIVKMSPQAFASLQHKPGQQIFLKQGSNATQHRVVGGNVLSSGEQLQFKTVHVLSSSQEKQLQQQSDPAASSSAAAATKPITVISQPQAVSRVLKATASNALLKQQQQQNIRNAATGQVVHVAPGSLAAPAGTQYAVVSQARSIISMGGQQRLVTTQAQAGRPPTVITTATTSASPAAAAKEKGNALPTKVFKKGNIVVAQPNTAMFTNLGGNLRLINASGVNTSGTMTAPTQATAFQLANLQGKQVVFASKSANGSPSLGGVKNVVNMSANQVQQLQNAGIIIGGQTIKLQNTLSKVANSGNIVTSQAGGAQSLQTVIVGNQVLRVQQLPQGMNRQGTVATSVANNTFVVNNTGGTDNATMPKTFLLGGQPVKLQTSVGNAQDQLKTTSANSSGRVVLAMPGAGGQVFLSPSMQGASSTFNLKSLQNMKVVSLANLQQQQQQIKTNATTTKLTELKGGSTDGDVAS